jgi:hypothetical protein
VRARPAALVPLAFVPTALAAAALLACSATTGERALWQRTYAWGLQPAPVRAPAGAERPAEIRPLRLLAYADADYQAHAPDWEQRIVDQVRRANEVLEPEFGVRFEVAVERWARSGGEAPLVEAMAALEKVDRRGADWVVGFVGPVPEDSWRDNLGLAPAFRAAFVVRAMESSAQLSQLALGLDTLGVEDRRRFALARRLHRETVVFLHEWAHTLGAPHECDGKWLMADGYGVLASTFSPESDRLIRIGLRHRNAAGGPSAAWRDAWRAESTRIRDYAWECSKLDAGLAEYDGVLERLVSRAAAP